MNKHRSTDEAKALEAAHAVVDSYAKHNGACWFSSVVTDRGTYWFFRVGYIGSSGVIVDKADLRLFPMGSALSLDDCFWGHEHGFSPEFLVLRIVAVHDLERTVEFLRRRAGEPDSRNPNVRRVWIRNALTVLPFDCPPQRLWLSIPIFRALEPLQSFEYRLFEKPGT